LRSDHSLVIPTMIAVGLLTTELYLSKGQSRLASYMNKLVEALLVFVAIVVVLLGAIFIMAGGRADVLTGAVLVVIAVVMFAFIYRVEKIAATKPTLVNQTFNVKMDGSGKFEDKEMKCKSCGAPLVDKDLKVVQGGIMVTCSYCGATYAMEEAPKW